MRTSRKPTVPIAYIDEVNAIDSRTRALIELCKGCCDPERLDPFVVEQVGSLFQDLLDRRRVVEHFFLGVEIDSQAVEDARAKAEVCYLKARHPDALKEAD